MRTKNIVAVVFLCIAFIAGIYLALMTRNSEYNALQDRIEQSRADYERVKQEVFDRLPQAEKDVLADAKTKYELVYAQVGKWYAPAIYAAAILGSSLLIAFFALITPSFPILSTKKEE